MIMIKKKVMIKMITIKAVMIIKIGMIKRMTMIRVVMTKKDDTPMIKIGRIGVNLTTFIQKEHLLFTLELQAMAMIQD